jgi:pimeloyl-ACP methyl ester carboxylesterase
LHELLLETVYSPGYREREAATLAQRRALLDRLPLAWFAGIRDLAAAVDDFDLTPRLGAVRAPACVVLSRGDRMMEPERSRALAAALGAERVEHPSAGHGLAVEEPEWLAGVCLEFLERQRTEVA